MPSLLAVFGDLVGASLFFPRYQPSQAWRVAMAIGENTRDRKKEVSELRKISEGLSKLTSFLEASKISVFSSFKQLFILARLLFSIMGLFDCK